MEQHLKKILVRTAAYYTVITALFSLLMLILQVDTVGAEEAGLSALRMFLFLPFSLMFAIANTLFDIDKLTPPLCWTLHCILTVTGAFICLVLPTTSEGSVRLVAGVVILICYLVVAIIVALFRHKLRKTIDESKKYSKKLK